MTTGTGATPPSWLIQARHAQAETRWFDAWAGFNLSEWTVGIRVLFDDIDRPSAQVALGLGPLYAGMRFAR